MGAVWQLPCGIGRYELSHGRKPVPLVGCLGALNKWVHNRGSGDSVQRLLWIPSRPTKLMEHPTTKRGHDLEPLQGTWATAKVFGNSTRHGSNKHIW